MWLVGTLGVPQPCRSRKGRLGIAPFPGFEVEFIAEGEA